MMEQLIASVLEQSILAGAFIYMLYAQTTRSDTTLTKITDQLGGMATTMFTLTSTMVTVGSTMSDISDTMEHMNARMESVEQRMERIEKRGNGNAG